ncbi:MAG: cytochrome C [Sulfurovum sp.]|nr:MAG: cytochrome C [Sulfurovum sp.]
MKKVLMVVAFLGLSLYGGDDQKAEYFYLTHGCQSCHGMYGEGVSAPRLQGVKEERLYERLKNLQAGKTRTTMGTVMITFAQSMDENMTHIMAHYLSTLKTPENSEYYEQDPNEDGTS